MSQENVELSLLIDDAWNGRDVEAVAALWDDEGVFYPAIEGSTEGGKTYGRAAVHQYYKDLAEFAEEIRTEYPEVDDLGDQVLALGRIWLRFASGVELDDEVACLYTWRNGRCVEARAWLSHAEALEAAGPSE